MISNGQLQLPPAAEYRKTSTDAQHYNLSPAGSLLRLLGTGGSRLEHLLLETHAAAAVVDVVVFLWLAVKFLFRCKDASRGKEGKKWL